MHRVMPPQLLVVRLSDETGEGTGRVPAGHVIAAIAYKDAVMRGQRPLLLE
jgi:hypothetical protein